MPEQPTGTVTLLFSDIEGSTSLLQRLGTKGYAEALDLHARLLREAFDRHGGYEVDSEGDSFFVAFDRAADAVAAASEAQHALARAQWPDAQPIRVRMGIHTGEPVAVPPKYVGLDVHKAARVMAAAHGGQVLLTKRTYDLLAGQAKVRELGTHRLKDLLQPEPLHQLLVPGLREEFPALKTLGNRPTNLPVVATAFIGREQELDAVEGLLGRDGVRLLTLTGPGGIGKTRLALQAAADLTDRFRDGVYWVPLASVRDPVLVAATVAHTLGLRGEGGELVDEILGRYLADKELLLVLDNLEHLVDGARELTALVLRTAPGVEILATTREALRIAGEQLYDVPPLALPAPDEALEQNDAVQLFVGRAQAADPAFALTSSNAAAIVEIVRRLEGLPLAIELAAARIRALPPPALLERLADRLRLLTTGMHDADERQRTLQATIAWSYDLLTAEERTLFARLAVFAGGCRLDAAEAVCDPDCGIDVLDGITSLNHKSLLQRRDDPDGLPRYWMLETIREYALSLLSIESMEAAHGRIAAHMLALGERAEPALRGKSARDWLLRLDADHAALRASLQWLIARRRSEEVSRLIATTWYFWVARGRLREVLPTARAALDLSYPHALDRAAVLANVGELLRHSGDDLGARPLKEEALTIFREHGNQHMEAALLVDLGEIAASQGDPIHARRFRRESLALREAIGDPIGIAHALAGLADDEAAAGDYDAARARIERLVELAREADDPEFTMYGLYYLGELAARQDRPDEAVMRFTQALGQSDAFGHLELTQAIIDGLGCTFAAAGDDERAAILWGAANAMREESGTGFAFFPGAAEVRDQAIEAARERASGCAFNDSWNRGRSLTTDEVIGEALAPQRS